MNRTTFFAPILLCAVGTAHAHEFWIEPGTYHAESGQLLRVSMKVGERWLGEQMRRDGSLIEKFALVHGAGEVPVVGRSGSNQSLVRTDGEGIAILVYQSQRRSNELDPKSFEQYLRMEGLEAIIARRASLGETERPGREVYSRCAKSLVTVGSKGDRGFDREVGLPLEIVPETNPFTVGVGETLTLRVLYDGKPLPHATVVFAQKKTPTNLVRARTDAEGRVEADVSASGEWMATTLHMVRAPAGADADWESFWASLTFEVRSKDRRMATK